MKLKTLLPGVAAVLMALTVSCTPDNPVNPDPTPKKGNKIVFSSVKEAGLPGGTKLGLFIGDPINCKNVALTVGEDGSITPSQELFWAAEQKQTSPVMAYGPYSASFGSANPASFALQTDQTTSANLAASDLIVATTTGNPAAAAVSLAFAHKMSCIKLYFNNKSAVDITKVEIENVVLSATVNTETGAVTSGTTTSTVSAFKADGYYMFYIVPQKSTLKMKVTFADSTVFETELKDAVDFAPGTVYSTDKSPIDIGIEAPKSIVLSFTVSDWVDGGQLNFNGDTPEPGDYDLVSDIAAAATSTSSSFTAKVNNVIVTCVSGKYAHLEDESAGIMVFMADHGLAAGQCISGEISGKVQLYDGGSKNLTSDNAYAEITDLDLTNATITTVSTLPETEVTVSELNSNITKYFNKRVLLKKVTVTEGISASVQSGTVSQGGSSITIFNKTKTAVIETGLTGDLICYPLIYKGALQVIIYTSDQFEEAGEPAEETAFAKLTKIGFYSNTDTDSPVESVAFDEFSDQLTFATGTNFRSFRIVNLEKNTFYTVKVNSKTLSVGQSYSASISSNNGAATNATLKVVNKKGSQIWLEDKTAHNGYVINIE